MFYSNSKSGTRTEPGGRRLFPECRDLSCQLHLFWLRRICPLLMNSHCLLPLLQGLSIISLSRRIPLDRQGKEPPQAWVIVWVPESVVCTALLPGTINVFTTVGYSSTATTNTTTTQVHTYNLKNHFVMVCIICVQEVQQEVEVETSMFSVKYVLCM